jgi:hypothetical protein
MMQKTGRTGIESFRMLLDFLSRRLIEQCCNVNSKRHTGRLEYEEQ